MKKIFPPDELHSNSLLRALSERCKGLIYTSETDAPVEAFIVPTDGRSAREVLADSYGSDDGAGEIVEQESDAFFTSVTRRAEWHDETRIKRAEAFQELRELLEENLRSVAVYRMGKINVAIFAAGIDDHGNLIGIRTRSVET